MLQQFKKMLLVKQISRMINDNGSHDRTFYDQEVKLQLARARLQKAVDAVVRASTELQSLITLQDNRLH